jgi:hypothetical protein
LRLAKKTNLSDLPSALSVAAAAPFFLANEALTGQTASRSVADRHAVLAHLRRTSIDAVFGVPHDRLISAETACAGQYLVAPLFEF